MIKFEQSFTEFERIFPTRDIVVWLIYPDDKLVEVYTGFKTVLICTEIDICSAKPVIETFEIAAEDLFSCIISWAFYGYLPC